MLYPVIIYLREREKKLLNFLLIFWFIDQGNFGSVFLIKFDCKLTVKVLDDMIKYYIPSSHSLNCIKSKIEENYFKKFFRQTSFGSAGAKGTSIRVTEILLYKMAIKLAKS